MLTSARLTGPVLTSARLTRARLTGPVLTRTMLTTFVLNRPLLTSPTIAILGLGQTLQERVLVKVRTFEYGMLVQGSFG